MAPGSHMRPGDSARTCTWPRTDTLAGLHTCFSWLCQLTRPGGNKAPAASGPFPGSNISDYGKPAPWGTGSFSDGGGMGGVHSLEHL